MTGRPYPGRDPASDAQRPALCGTRETLSAPALAERVERLAVAFRHAAPRPRMLGVLADNGPDWVVIDLAAERARLAKELSKVEADIKRVDGKLGNADFLKRAPEEVVEGEREKRDEAEARRGKIIEALEQLKDVS